MLYFTSHPLPRSLSETMARGLSASWTLTPSHEATLFHPEFTDFVSEIEREEAPHFDSGTLVVGKPGIVSSPRTAQSHPGASLFFIPSIRNKNPSMNAGKHSILTAGEQSFGYIAWQALLLPSLRSEI